jgi:hypothetical protein
VGKSVALLELLPVAACGGTEASDAAVTTTNTVFVEVDPNRELVRAG